MYGKQNILYIWCRSVYPLSIGHMHLQCHPVLIIDALNFKSVMKLIEHFLPSKYDVRFLLPEKGLTVRLVRGAASSFVSLGHYPIKKSITYKLFDMSLFF